jgi:thiamine-phosphate pyrophosphorylase
MKIVVISPEGDDCGELAAVNGLFVAGLERYHVRKPQWEAPRIAAWLESFPSEQRRRMILHQHHKLAALFGLGGCHWRDDDVEPPFPGVKNCFSSRAVHSLECLNGALGRFDAVLLSPIFPSLSKPGYGPGQSLAPERIRERMAARTEAERRTLVYALGGVTEANAPTCLRMGFDGVALKGAVWGSEDPVRAFLKIQKAICSEQRTAAELQFQ